MLATVHNRVTYSQPCLCNAKDTCLPLDFDMPTKPSSLSDLAETRPKRGNESTAGPPLASSGCGSGAASSGITVARGSLGIVTVRRNFEGSMPLELLRNLRYMMSPTRNYRNNTFAYINAKASRSTSFVKRRMMAALLCMSSRSVLFTSENVTALPFKGTTMDFSWLGCEWSTMTGSNLRDFFAKSAL